MDRSPSPPPLRPEIIQTDEEFLPSTIRLEQVSFQPSSVTIDGESLKAIIENYLLYYASGEGHTARAKQYDLQYFLLFLAKDRKNQGRVQAVDWTLQATKDFIEHRLQYLVKPRPQFLDVLPPSSTLAGRWPSILPATLTQPEK